MGERLIKIHSLYRTVEIQGHRYLVPRATLRGSFLNSRIEKVRRRVFRYAVCDALRLAPQ